MPALKNAIQKVGTTVVKVFTAVVSAANDGFSSDKEKLKEKKFLNSHFFAVVQNFAKQEVSFCFPYRNQKYKKN